MINLDKDGNDIRVPQNLDEERKAAFDQICKKAILVNMTRKQISNMPFDVKSSQHLCEVLKVKDQHMIMVRKLLFNPQHLSKIRSLINDALLMVWNHTRPWDNIGFRLLPMEYYDDFNETFGKIKDEFEEAVREFIENYDKYLAESKDLLGEAFNPNDYPDKSQLAAFFAIEMHTSKFPDIDDIRLNMSGPELMAMQKDITDRYNDTIRESIDELMTLVSAGDKTGAAKLLDVVEKLNLNNDPEVELLLTEARDKIGAMPEPEKTDEPEKMMVIDDVEGIDEVVDDYM